MSMGPVDTNDSPSSETLAGKFVRTDLMYVSPDVSCEIRITNLPQLDFLSCNMFKIKKYIARRF
jgi:hypothetical protein